MAGVRGILFDSSVILSSDATDGVPAVAPAADYLLRKLRYSNIPIGISHEQGLSSSKECLLQELATTYSCAIFFFSPENDISTVVAQSWEDKGGDFLHVVSSGKEDLCHKGNDHGWLKVTVAGSAAREPSTDANDVVATGISSIFINQLEELLLLICQLNKKAIGEEALIVGYVMKPSREGDFAKRGAFPMQPTQNGLIFLPLNYDLPIASQLQLADAVLHKATDEIVAFDMGSLLVSAGEVTFTENLLELRRHIKCLDCCVIDQFNSILPILDRFRIQQILVGLETLNIQGCCKIRPPHYLKVDRFDEPDLEQRLAEAKLSLPNIVKPQVACGVSDAHNMAIVFEVDHFKDLNVTLPAVVQEYVDHSALIYKFYSLGGKLFYAVKKSIPNADVLRSLSPENEMKPILFDSLKSLPVAKEQLDVVNHQIDLDLVNRAADWLRITLDLTIFGFDVVVQDDTGDHVIVDVNYLPSFKEVPDDVAIPAFWDALKEKILSVKSNQAS